MIHRVLLVCYRKTQVERPCGQAKSFTLPSSSPLAKKEKINKYKIQAEKRRYKNIYKNKTKRQTKNKLEKNFFFLYIYILGWPLLFFFFFSARRPGPWALRPAPFSLGSSCFGACGLVQGASRSEPNRQA